VFELVTAIDIDAAARTARGRAFVPAEHLALREQVTGEPLLPESWTLELMAQIAGPLAEVVAAAAQGRPRWALLGMVRQARFEGRTPLPARVEVKAVLERLSTNAATVTTEAWHDAGRCAVADLMMLLVDQAPPAADRERALRLERWQRGWRA
jgi:hypothetical protein